jgi:hypothetical protein
MIRSNCTEEPADPEFLAWISAEQFYHFDTRGIMQRFVCEPNRTRVVFGAGRFERIAEEAESIGERLLHLLENAFDGCEPLQVQGRQHRRTSDG